MKRLVLHEYNCNIKYLQALPVYFRPVLLARMGA
jgi:hypothetical protein